MKGKKHYERKKRYEGINGVTYIPTKKMTDWLNLNKLFQWAKNFVFKPPPEIQVGEMVWVDSEKGEIYIKVDTQDFANFLNGKPHSGGAV